MSALGQPKSWRRAAAMARIARAESGARTRRKVLWALAGEALPLSVADIARIARISPDRCRRALETLAALKAVAVSGPSNWPRRYALARAPLTGAGIPSGDPASASSPMEARPGVSQTSIGRPGNGKP